MKNPVTATLSVGLALGVISPGSAATITTFAQLDATTATNSAAVGTENFSQPDNSMSVTFDFDMTTKATLATAHLLDFGGANGASLRLEGSRIVFRSYTGSDMLYVESTDLAPNTSYRVTGSIFMDDVGTSDMMRLYLNEADAVDSGATHYQPTANVGTTWRGGNGAGYAIVGGGGYLNGTPGANGNSGFSPVDTSLFDSPLDIYEGTFLEAGAGASVIPEPSSSVMLGLTGLFVCLLRRRR